MSWNEPGDDKEMLYQQGYDQGLAEGMKRGYARGWAIGRETGYNQGYARGFEDGYDRGYQEGEHLGYNNGFLEGFDLVNMQATIKENGTAQGTSTGEKTGERENYRAVEDAEQLWKQARNLLTGGDVQLLLSGSRARPLVVLLKGLGINALWRDG